MRLAISRCGWLSSLLVAPKSSVCLTSCLADRQPVFTSRERFTKLVCRVLGAFAESSITCSVKISRGYALCFERINFWYRIFSFASLPFWQTLCFYIFFSIPPNVVAPFYIHISSIHLLYREWERQRESPASGGWVDLLSCRTALVRVNVKQLLHYPILSLLREAESIGFPGVQYQCESLCNNACKRPASGGWVERK